MPAGLPGSGNLHREARPSLQRLKRRQDFLRVAAEGRKSASPGLVLQVAASDADEPEGRGLRVGFTASRKVGGAVQRNRARRRLKALAKEILPEHAEPRMDYVLVAREAILRRRYEDLRQDLSTALRRLKAWRKDTE